MRQWRRILRCSEQSGSYWSVQHAASCRLLSEYTHRNTKFHICYTSVTIDPSLQGWAQAVCVEQQGADMICTAHRISSQWSSGASGTNGEDVHLYLFGTTEGTRLFELPRRRRKNNIKIDLKGTDGAGSRQWKVDGCIWQHNWLSTVQYCPVA
jgi:hypothetical protein